MEPRDIGIIDEVEVYSLVNPLVHKVAEEELVLVSIESSRA
jgi:hypothetical protein